MFAILTFSNGRGGVLAVPPRNPVGGIFVCIYRGQLGRYFLSIHRVSIGFWKQTAKDAPKYNGPHLLKVMSGNTQSIHRFWQSRGAFRVQGLHL